MVDESTGEEGIDPAEMDDPAFAALLNGLPPSTPEQVQELREWRKQRERDRKEIEQARAAGLLGPIDDRDSSK